MSADNPYSILIADDNPNNLKVLSSMLEDQGYKIRMSCNGKQALKSIELMPPDLVMLDIHMPELDGYDTCRELKSNENFRDIPVIFVSAMSEGFNKLLAYEVGGIDYIVKPFQLEEVITRVQTQLALHEHTRRCRECDKLKGAIDVMKDTLNAFNTAVNLSEEQKIRLDILKRKIDSFAEIPDSFSDIHLKDQRN